VYGGNTARARSPLIGREPVLGELEAIYQRVREDGSGDSVLLWGEAGVGKTRLLDEFAGRAAAEGARIGTSACLEGLCPPYAPLREAFAALGLPAFFEPNLERDFLAVVAALAVCGSSVILLDDLQWADFASLEFLAFLARRVEQVPVLVVSTVRSDDLERDYARLEALNRLLRNGTRRLNVDPLNREEMRRLVSILWPGESPERIAQVERVCSLAEGKPYFAEELVSTASTLGVSPRFDPAPLSIRAGVLARFERLPRDDRTLLLHASVIGQSFDATLLARLACVPASAVLAALASARDLQLVREAEGSSTFSFRHAITREILYRELLQGQRENIHRELAALLERAQPPGDAGQIAFHFGAAGERERATRAYELAGDRAAERNAHRDAEDAYRRAVLSRDDSDPNLAPLCEKFSRALSIVGNLADACAYLERAVDRYAEGGNTARAAMLAARLARRYFEHARHDEATQAALRSLRLCDGRGSTAFDAHVTLAHFAALHGRTDDADEQLRLAEGVPGSQSPSGLRDFHMVRAVLRATTARLGLAFEDYERALTLAREMGDPEQLAWALSNYASRALATGHTQRALDAYREAVAKLPLDEFGKIGALANQGFASVCLMSGDLQEARHAQARGRRSTSAMALTQTAAIAMEIRLAYLAGETLPLDQNDVDDAIAVAFGSGETQNIGLLSGCLAAYYDAIGRAGEAVALRSRAIAAISSADLSLWLIDQLAGSDRPGERAKARSLLRGAAADDVHLAARAHLALFDARVARRERRVVRAKLLATQAADAFEAIGWPWERAAALEVAGRPAQARTIYEQHGYVRQLRELDASRRRARHRPARDRLTPRELEVAQLAAGGKSNREIAALLFIGERTVETHIAAIFDRFDLTSRRELATLVAEQH
jgi:DNA-binding CsgD family transcriptional regulator/tetratricopeptide (TPR) repeat protein